MGRTPEDEAREVIDHMLQKAGWHVCNVTDANIYAHRGVVIRNFPLKSGHGFADYIVSIFFSVMNSGRIPNEFLSPFLPIGIPVAIEFQKPQS